MQKRKLLKRLPLRHKLLSPQNFLISIYLKQTGKAFPPCGRLFSFTTTKRTHKKTPLFHYTPTMIKQDSRLLPHLIAFITVTIWGTTFVWTKLLIAAGISPAQIFTLRFVMAYALMLAFSLTGRKRTRHQWLCQSWKDEMLMVALGITGGSIYFLAENEALRFTTATNASLILAHTL